jgi:hypothetical protein
MRSLVRIVKGVLFSTAGLLLCGCPAIQTRPLAQPSRVGVAGPYVHAGSGIALPEKIGEFQREAVTPYDARGLDVGVAYNCLNVLHPMAATVYVYPSPSLVSISSPQHVIDDARARLTQREFERVLHEIRAAHPGAKLIAQREISHSEHGKIHPGKLATFEYDGPFAGRTRPVRSHVYLFCYLREKWTVKYRFTHPEADDGEKEIQEFLDGWSWGQD